MVLDGCGRGRDVFSFGHGVLSGFCFGIMMRLGHCTGFDATDLDYGVSIMRYGMVSDLQGAIVSAQHGMGFAVVLYILPIGFRK